ncbi:uncharacterized protein LOC120135123 [Hibiscus syriacus]|uniref:uncharacterized protein LOC120135123 n=1 Tax=Hibiscus syriacus TaxID=106335 RepID=UPI001921F85F|nr:uncharacterized protein LOC120135123 [Hibiscus syriacus]
MKQTKKQYHKGRSNRYKLITLYEGKTGKALKPVGDALQRISASRYKLITLELLSGKENALLIDVWPEVLRERDGIPDLRRAARSRYASVYLPEVNGSIRNLMKSGRDLDDSLIATVIRNLKTIEGRSKVIIVDDDGSRSKGIARSLRKLGITKPYLVQGGFRYWVNQLSELRNSNQRTLTILNEEAEEILKEISPSPVQVLGFCVGSVAAIYALLEWEKSLQLIGIVGLVLTIYRRVSSYEGPEDLKEDIRLLLAPVRFGALTFSWVSGKLETNGIGLPTSPSLSEAQSLVLQAAAKHESKPSDSEDPSANAVTPMNEKVDLSKA